MNIIGEMANYKIHEAISYFQEKKTILKGCIKLAFA